MRKSRGETAETRDKIIAKAAQLFLTRGLNSVGMRDVMSAAELTTGGFYRHFSSMENLMAVAVRSAFDRLFAMFETKIEGRTPAQALEQIVTLYLQQAQAGSGETAQYLCPLAQVGSELRHSGTSIQAVAHEGQQRLVSLIARCLAGLSKEQAAANANNIVTTLVGAVTLAGIAPDAATARRTLTAAKRSILALHSHTAAAL